MSLREQAALDCRAILEDTAGFGWPITVTSPEGLVLAMTGMSTDVSLTVDPQTGMAVSERKASVALSIRTLEEAGLGIPRAVADPKSQPWSIRFADVVGRARDFKVCESHPDRKLGVVTCMLEAYLAG